MHLRRVLYPILELGPLTDLPGTWVGSGFTVIWLPVYQGNPDFRLKLNATSETFTVTKIGADIPNRGSIQPDLHFLGVHYLQLVSDAATHGQLHIEPGMWLNLPPAPANPNPNVSFVARLASIPHGNALLAQGTTYQRTKPSFPIENTMPGPPVPSRASGMLNNAVLPPGIRQDCQEPKSRPVECSFPAEDHKDRRAGDRHGLYHSTP